MTGQTKRSTGSGTATTQPMDSCDHGGGIAAEIARLCGSGDEALWFDHAYATEGASRLRVLQRPRPTAAGAAGVPSTPITEITRETLQHALQLGDGPGDEMIRFEARGAGDEDHWPALAALWKANNESPEQQQRVQALVDLLTKRLQCLHAVVLGREVTKNRDWPHRLLIVGIDENGELAGVESEIIWTG